MKKNVPLLHRRDWLKTTGTLGLGAAASAVALSSATGAEKRGLTYRKILDSAPWSPRSGMGAVVFQNRLWLLGGTGTAKNGTQLNDVWSSEDGLHWRQELASAPWQPRWNHATFVHAGKLWVIGGLASVDPLLNLNDIWSSPDGKKWTREVADAPWTGRHVWAWTNHRNRMYLLGGATDGARTYRDVLSSDDGIDWQLAPVRDPWFVKRKYHAAASYRGQIFLAGGIVNDKSQLYGSRYLDDVWTSKDGLVWNCQESPVPWKARGAHTLVVYKERLWLVGGELQSRYYAEDMWSTTSGTDWRQETDQLAWPGRIFGGVVVFKNKVWIMGGSHRDWPKREGSSLNDIWTFEA